MSILLNSDSPGPLIALWSKYRPVILHLMQASSQGPQQYKLYAHEFRALSKTPTFSFLLQMHKGRALNDIRKSKIAQDLMSMLKMSRQATDHMDKHAFEFRLDTHFMLNVARV